MSQLQNGFGYCNSNCFRIANSSFGGNVHRDIKPDNVMIRADGLAKIIGLWNRQVSEPPAVAGGLSEDDATAIKIANNSPE